MSEVKRARPGGVTVVAVMVWLSGAINLITGVLLLFQMGNTELATRVGGTVPLVSLAIATAILGAVTLIVASGLLRGSNGARVVVTIFQVLSIGAAVYISFAAPWLLWVAVVSILISVGVLALLYAGKAAAFFR